MPAYPFWNGGDHTKVYKREPERCSLGLVWRRGSQGTKLARQVLQGLYKKVAGVGIGVYKVVDKDLLEVGVE